MRIRVQTVLISRPTAIGFRRSDRAHQRSAGRCGRVISAIGTSTVSIAFDVDDRESYNAAGYSHAAAHCDHFAASVSDDPGSKR